MTKDIGQADVFTALRQVRDPAQGEDIITLNMVSGLQIKDSQVLFALEVDPARGPEMEPLRQKAEEAVRALGFERVTAVLTAKRRNQTDQSPAKKGPQPLSRMPDIKHIIAVASGKGGVGKSTVAVNLAAALAQRGLKTGIMDADIYGPSVPRMLGISGQKPDIQDEKLRPIEAHGLKVMSMGFMVEEDTPMIWRGPMIQTALRQFLEDVDWGSLDVLVVDMPPGTGDAQLTMAQKVPLAGAIIVSTPQDIALIDARKGIEMFRKVDVPVLGIVENMSVYICPRCGHEEHIFGQQGAEKEAEKQGCAFLGAIPLEVDVRLKSDAGAPPVLSLPQSDTARIFIEIAGKVTARLKRAQAA